MKKVLFVATVTVHINSFHIPYLKMFKEKGYEVHVASYGDESIEYCDKHFNIPFARFPLKPQNYKAYKELKNIIKYNEYEIIHCHTPVGGVLTRLATKKTRKKGTRVIYTAHGFHFYKGAPLINWMIYYPLEKWLSRYTDCLITINQEDYELAKKKFKAKQIELVHGVGVDESKFNFEMTKEEKYKLRESLGLKDDDFVLIQVGELNKNKNQIMSINAMKNLVKENPKIHLLLVGKGKLEEFYRQKIKKYNLQQNVHLLGYRTDIPNLMKISNVLLSLSYREGLPVNVIEGIMAGLPIIATDCRGNRDLIKDEINGYIVDINDVEELIHKIILLKNNTMYPKNNINGYSKKNIKIKMNKLYNSVTRKKIIHLLSSTTFSGAENVVCQIIKMFDNSNNGHEMIYCSPEGKIRQKLLEENIKYIGINRLNYSCFKYVVNQYNPDIIHAHDVRASIIASLFSRKSMIISHIHGNHDEMKKITIKSLLYCLFRRKYSKIFWVSKSAMNEFYFKNKVKDKSELLINVIDKQQIYEKVEIDEEKYDYDIIYLGRLSEEKNPLRVYELMHEVVKMNNKARCVFVGDGVLKEKLKGKIEKDKMSENIEVKGNMENPMKILKSSKMLLMASRYEGTPMSALEAMSLGVPIVSTPTDGLVELVKNHVNGFLSENNKKLILEMNKIIDNQEYREKLSKNAMEIFDKNNDIDNYRKTIEKEYDK